MTAFDVAARTLAWLLAVAMVGVPLLIWLALLAALGHGAARRLRERFGRSAPAPAQPLGPAAATSTPAAGRRPTPPWVTSPVPQVVPRWAGPLDDQPADIIAAVVQAKARARS